MKRNTKRTLGFVALLLLVVGNVVCYNHAHSFTHFTETGSRTQKPEMLTTAEKIKTLFTGVSIPKPVNDKKPKQPYETIELQSHEKLEGWLIKKPKHRGLVILFHGYSSSKSGILNYSNEFQKMGYSTLLIDFMGSGGSEGLQTTIGMKESRDVNVAFEFAKNNYPNDEIILFGSSMGAVSIMKAINDYDLEPEKIILECPFGSMVGTTKKRFEAMGLPSFPMAEILLFYGGLQNGFNAFTHNPTEYAKNIETPTLLIRGAKDKRVTATEVDEIFENLKGEKELLRLEKSGHENYLINSREIWIEAAQKFLGLDVRQDHPIAKQDFTQIQNKFHKTNTPLIDKSNFDKIEEPKYFSKAEIELLKLDEIFEEESDSHHGFLYAPNYQLQFSDNFVSLVFLAFMGDHEMESVLINYSLDGNIIDHKVIAYDEIAEGWSQISSSITKNKITRSEIFYGDEKEVNISEYRIDSNGEIITLKLNYGGEIPPDGNYIFDMAFAEFQGKSMGAQVRVKIKGDRIKVIYEGVGNLTAENGTIFEEGLIIKHQKSGEWIISQNPKDKFAEEIGGCSDGPAIIDFINKKFWAC